MKYNDGNFVNDYDDSEYGDFDYDDPERVRGSDYDYDDDSVDRDVEELAKTLEEADRRAREFESNRAKKTDSLKKSIKSAKGKAEEKIKEEEKKEKEWEEKLKKAEEKLKKITAEIDKEIEETKKLGNDPVKLTGLGNLKQELKNVVEREAETEGTFEAIRQVYQRANYRSEVGGGVGGAVHHLNGYNWDVKGRIDPNNLILLSDEVHEEFHKSYGAGNNSIEQFLEFVYSNHSYDIPSFEKNYMGKYGTPKNMNDKLIGANPYWDDKIRDKQFARYIHLPWLANLKDTSLKPLVDIIPYSSFFLKDMEVPLNGEYNIRDNVFKTAQIATSDSDILNLYDAVTKANFENYGEKTDEELINILLSRRLVENIHGFDLGGYDRALDLSNKLNNGMLDDKFREQLWGELEDSHSIGRGMLLDRINGKLELPFLDGDNPSIFEDVGLGRGLPEVINKLKNFFDEYGAYLEMENPFKGWDISKGLSDPSNEEFIKNLLDDSIGHILTIFSRRLPVADDVTDGELDSKDGTSRKRISRFKNEAYENRQLEKPDKRIKDIDDAYRSIEYLVGISRLGTDNESIAKFFTFDGRNRYVHDDYAKKAIIMDTKKRPIKGQVGENASGLAQAKDAYDLYEDNDSFMNIDPYKTVLLGGNVVKDNDDLWNKELEGFLRFDGSIPLDGWYEEWEGFSRYDNNIQIPKSVLEPLINLKDPNCCKLLRETVEKINDNVVALRNAFENAKFVVNGGSDSNIKSKPSKKEFTVSGFSVEEFSRREEKRREEESKEIDSRGRVNYTLRKQNLARWAEEAKDLEFREKAQKAFKVASEMTSPTGFNGRVANQDLVEGFLGEVPIEGYSTEDIKRFMQEHSEVKDKIEKASAFNLDEIISRITILKNELSRQEGKIRKGDYLKKREELQNLLYEINPAYKEYVEISKTIDKLKQEKEDKTHSGKDTWTEKDEDKLRSAVKKRYNLSKLSDVKAGKGSISYFNERFKYANKRGWLDNPIVALLKKTLDTQETKRSQAFTEEEAEMYRLLDIAYSTVLGDNPPNPEGAIHGLYNSTILKVKKAILDDKGRKGDYNALKNRMIGYEERLGNDDIKVDESTYVDIIKAIDKQKDNLSNAKTRVSKSTAKRKLESLENLRDYLVRIIGIDQAETWEYNWYNREEIDKQIREGTFNTDHYRDWEKYTIYNGNIPLGYGKFPTGEGGLGKESFEGDTWGAYETEGIYFENPLLKAIRERNESINKEIKRLDEIKANVLSERTKEDLERIIEQKKSMTVSAPPIVQMYGAIEHTSESSEGLFDTRWGFLKSRYENLKEQILPLQDMVISPDVSNETMEEFNELIRKITQIHALINRLKEETPLDEKWVGEINSVTNDFDNLTKPVEKLKEDDALQKSFEKVPLRGRLTNLAYNFDRATRSANQFTGVLTKLFSIVGTGNALNDMITASSLRQTNQIMLASSRGMEEAKKLYDRIQMLVVKLPGNDTFLTNILTMLGTMDKSLSAEEIEYMGGVIADYYMGAQAKGQFNNETERELRNYLMTGQTRNLTNSIIASEIESLKNLNSVKERTIALENALKATGMDSIAHYDSYTNSLEEFKGRFQKSFADLGDTYLWFLQLGMKVYNFFDSLTNSTLSQVTITLAVVAMGTLAFIGVVSELLSISAGLVESFDTMENLLKKTDKQYSSLAQMLRKVIAWIAVKTGVMKKDTVAHIINTDAVEMNTLSVIKNSLSSAKNALVKRGLSWSNITETLSRIWNTVAIYNETTATAVETEAEVANNLVKNLNNLETTYNTFNHMVNAQAKIRNAVITGAETEAEVVNTGAKTLNTGATIGNIWAKLMKIKTEIGSIISITSESMAEQYNLWVKGEVTFMTMLAGEANIFLTGTIEALKIALGPVGVIFEIIGDSLWVFIMLAMMLIPLIWNVGESFGVWGAIWAPIESVLNGISGFLGMIGSGINRIWGAFVNSEPIQYMITTFQNFAYTLEGVFNLIRDIGGSIWEMVFGVDKGGNKVFDILGLFLEVIGAIGNFAFMTSPIRIILDIINAIGSAIAWVLDTWNEFIDSAEFQGLLKDFQEIREIIGEAWGTLTEAFNEVRDAFMSVFEDDDEMKEMVENTNILLEALKAVAIFLRVTVVPVIRLIAYIIKGIADVIKFVVDVGIGVVDLFTGGALTNEASSLPTQKQLAQSYSNRVNNNQTIINNNFASGSVLTDARNMTAKEVMKLFTSAFGFNKSRGVNGVLS